MYTHILFPTDGSDCSRPALETVVALARAHGARVTVLHAVRLPLPSGTPALGLSPSQAFSVQEITDIFEKQASTLLGQTVEKLEAVGIAAAARLSHLEPREAIQEAVAAEGCDLIVMGAHHHSTLRRVLLGSVSSYVANHTHVPLLIVPEHGPAWAADV